MFLVIPITMVAAFNNDGTLVAPVAGNVNLLPLEIISYIYYIRQIFKSMERQLKALNHI